MTPAYRKANRFGFKYFRVCWPSSYCACKTRLVFLSPQNYLTWDIHALWYYHNSCGRWEAPAEALDSILMLCKKSQRTRHTFSLACKKFSQATWMLNIILIQLFRITGMTNFVIWLHLDTRKSLTWRNIGTQHENGTAPHYKEILFAQKMLRVYLQ